jgi:hypothetical protein
MDVRPRGPVRRRRVDGGITWSPQIAYALGLMATDGNLSGRKGPMSLVSRDLDQIETLRHCLQLEAPISRVRSATGFLHKVQWHDHDLYDWFLRLTPAKSRTIGPLAVPDELFADFFRGCIDGDGSVLVYTDRYHAAKCPHSVYERLYVSLVSARQSGKIPRPAGLCLGTFSRATQSRVVVHCASQWRIEPGPGWCNGSHAGLKIQCPRGRAGSTPAPGTNP